MGRHGARPGRTAARACRLKEGTIRFAFAIVRLFNHGGLQRDCMAIARRVMARGHAVQIVCASADAPPDDLDVHVLPVRALTNHGRNTRFSRRVARHVAHGFDAVVGFDALEGLDALYCANPPVRMRRALDHINPRKRALLALERACFGEKSRTRLMLLSATQRDAYDRRWRLDAARVTLIPPTIERSRVVPHDGRAALRHAVRAALRIEPKQFVWLFVGGFPQTKGLDRLIAALPDFPNVRVLSVGQRDDRTAAFRAQAERLNVASRIEWLGVRDDIGALMVASDLLVHPSRLDITGTVILEALANGLPVITTAACGYAPHVAEAEAGRSLAEPFVQEDFAAALREARTSVHAAWRTNADRYAQTVDLTSGLDVAATLIADGLG